ncbi:hypothetical protein DY000_02018715 [Brassica cretica]|uniref:Uncharacterized protein n=1 Tax=Brassica cretica TaxID=69181 RepID=A0ABQ7CZD7_BRACR|nr:hypothetical protein DY000_02018715 [Brassica cretica]
MFALLYGLSFASFFATISHVTLYDGMFIWGMWKKATTARKDNFGDVHSRLMKKNYQAVPLTQIRAALPFHPHLSILVLIEFTISGKWQPCNNVYAEIMFWLSRRRRFPSGVWSEREHYGNIFNIICENLAVIELEQIFGIKCGDSS